MAIDFPFSFLHNVQLFLFFVCKKHPAIYVAGLVAKELRVFESSAKKSV